jgi:sulfide:quinone oxidoreductase
MRIMQWAMWSRQIHIAAQSFSNVFSGDSSSAPTSKTGAAIRKQAPVVVENLLAVMENKTPISSLTRTIAPALSLHNGKLMLAEFDYSNTQK